MYALGLVNESITARLTKRMTVYATRSTVGGGHEIALKSVKPLPGVYTSVDTG